MYKLIVLMSAILIACNMATAGSAKTEQPIMWTIKTTFDTNEVSESTYNSKTNGYSWTDTFAISAPRNINYTDLTYMNITCATNALWTGYNQSNVDSPDPFKEKITIKYYQVVSNDIYYLNVGPFTDEYKAKHTVIKRWKTKHVQKINMSESLETKQE